MFGPPDVGHGPTNEPEAPVSESEELTAVPDRLDMVIDVAPDYATSTLAAGEVLRPGAP